MGKIRVVAADDHKLFLEAFELLLRHFDPKENLQVVATACTIQDLMEILLREKVDLLFLDLNMGDTDAVEIIPKLKERAKALRIICLSMYKDDKTIREAMRKGADGYLSKNTNPAELLEAIQQVMDGQIFLGADLRITHPKSAAKGTQPVQINRFNAKFQLTKREKEILELIAKGKSNKDMANILFISKDTVSVHRKNLMRKLNVNSVSSLLKVAFDYNLV